MRTLAAAAAAIAITAALGACSAGNSPAGQTATTEAADAATGDTASPADSDGTDEATTAAPAGGDCTAATVFKASFNQGENHPEFISLKELGDELCAQTDGRYGIEIFANESLAPQAESLELLSAGGLEMAFMAGTLMENYNEDFKVFNLPFVFSSQEHQMSTINDPDLTGDLYNSLNDQGIKVLGGFHSGTRNVYNNTKPITSPADLAGMKIRVMQSDTMVGMLNEMGGVGTPMGQGDVYTAVQNGTLDGAENNEVTFANLKHYEIAKYYSYTRHVMMPDYLLINSSTFDAMSPEDQAILTDLTTKAEAREVELWNEMEQDAIDEAKAAGVEFNEADSEAFASKLAPYTESQLDNDVQKDLYAKVRAAA
jgi:tripartite ATP-independent transporter DctP family solute receptor